MSMKLLGGAAALAAAAFLAGCAGERESVDQTALISDGRDIADANCAACHAVGSYGESPNPASPPFRYILARYGQNNLENDLIEGIQIAHPMPEFQMNPKGVDALIAYLKTIQEEPPTGQK